MIYLKQYSLYKLQCQIEKITDAVKAQYPQLDAKNIYINHDWHDLEHGLNYFEYYILDSAKDYNSQLYTVKVNCNTRKMKITSHIGFREDQDGESFKVELPTENSKLWEVIETCLKKLVSTVIA